MVTLRSTTLNQNGEAVQVLTARLVVPRRPGAPPRAAADRQP
jgi:acyl dehydratase